MAVKVSKINLWFKYFIDETCSTTFLNRKESAKKAGYKTKDDESLRVIGYQNFIKLTDKIEKWLDEVGLSESALRLKLLSLLEAKETKFMKIKGYIGDDRLPEGSRSMGTSGIIVPVKGKDNEEEKYADGETLVAIDTNAIETQRKTLDMALKIRGMFKEDNAQKVIKNLEVTFK